MSALTEAIITELENLEMDIARCTSDGSDASNFLRRKAELSKRLSEANEQLQKKQLLKG